MKFYFIIKSSNYKEKKLVNPDLFINSLNIFFSSTLCLKFK